MHSEAVKRPVVLFQKGAEATRINGEGSFFVSAGYLVFQIDVLAGDEGAEAQTLSGAINLGRSTGSLFVSDGSELANGGVTLADESPQILHMEPGVLATWANGYVLEVVGTPAVAKAPLAAVARRDTTPVPLVIADYLQLGFLHIIPRGFDHILFVIGLFLLAPKRRELLWQVSAFTVAHTLSLALAATGVIRLPASIVEPLIALSILWIAVENIFTRKLHRWRIAVVFCFGLLHGLGFAGALLDIGLSGAHFFTALLAFNVGVELGQLSVIALCFLAVGWATQSASYRRRVVVPASCAIALIGAFWVIQRIGPLERALRPASTDTACIIHVKDKNRSLEMDPFANFAKPKGRS